MYWKYNLTHTIRQNLKIDKEIFLQETEVRIFAISNNLQSFYSVANLAIFILFVKEILSGNTSEMLTSNVGFWRLKTNSAILFTYGLRTHFNAYATYRGEELSQLRFW